MRHGTPDIIDFEASGFGPNSYPIEVGLALSNGYRYCRLIKPDKKWSEWQEDAEKVHGISRAKIEKHGASIKDVANELNGLLEGKAVYSDGWVVDEPWLIKLYEKAKVARRFYMYDILTIMSEESLAHWHNIKEQVIKESELIRHRASNDALIIQQTYVRVQKLLKKAS